VTTSRNLAIPGKKGFTGTESFSKKFSALVVKLSNPSIDEKVNNGAFANLISMITSHDHIVRNAFTNGSVEIWVWNLSCWTKCYPMGDLLKRAIWTYIIHHYGNLLFFNGLFLRCYRVRVPAVADRSDSTKHL
jgi:hypothetical protein